MVPNILEDEYMLMVETLTNFDKITYGLRLVWGLSVDSNKMDALGGRLPKRDGIDHAGLQTAVQLRLMLSACPQTSILEHIDIACFSLHFAPA